MKLYVFFRMFMVLGMVVSLSQRAFCQAEPPTGHDAAAKYFQKTRGVEEIPREHFLALHVGHFMSTEAWEWGVHGRETDTGSGTAGVTYRVKEWTNSMDFALRIDFNQYNVGGINPIKMSFLPALIFPEASSHFPIYFGGAAGLGVFFQQVDSKSPLALDYQLFAGARFLNIFENTGFFIESGIKNSLFLTTTGQFNGVFLAGGAAFTF